MEFAGLYIFFPTFSPFGGQRGFVVIGLLPISHPARVLFSFNKASLCAKQLVLVSFGYCSLLMLEGETNALQVHLSSGPALLPKKVTLGEIQNDLCTIVFLYLRSL